jgi:hypothetical protein
MTDSAEAGLTTHELMGRSGHKSIRMVELYTQGADRVRLAEAGDAKLRKRRIQK